MLVYFLFLCALPQPWYAYIYIYTHTHTYICVYIYIYMSNGMHLAFAFYWRVVLFIGHVLSGADDLLGKIRMGRKVADNRM